jgi:hypothetical protein
MLTARQGKASLKGMGRHGKAQIQGKAKGKVRQASQAIITDKAHRQGNATLTGKAI